MIKRLILLTTIMMFVCMPIVSATTFNLTNTTSRGIDNVTYPETLFYAIFLVGATMIVFNIRFLTSPDTPGASLIFTSVLGFMAFLICAYMAPMVAKQVWIVSGSEAQFISTYIFSPWVTYLLYGLSLLCFLMIWYGVIRLYQIFAANQKYLRDPDHQFDMYMKGGN